MFVGTEVGVEVAITVCVGVLVTVLVGIGVAVAVAERVGVLVGVFLWHSLGINDQYTGTGYTKPPNGERGVEEYLIENTLISQIPDSRVIDLKVQ